VPPLANRNLSCSNSSLIFPLNDSNIAILPRAARFDEERPDVQYFSTRACTRLAVNSEPLSERKWTGTPAHRIASQQLPAHPDGQAAPTVQPDTHELFVDDIQDTKFDAVGGCDLHGNHNSRHALEFRSQPHD